MEMGTVPLYRAPLPPSGSWRVCVCVCVSVCLSVLWNPRIGCWPFTPAWPVYSAPFPRGLAPGWGPGCLLGWKCLCLSPSLPQVNQGAASEVPRPRTVRIPAYVCVKVGHGLDSRKCFSWQAPAGVGAQAGACAAKQAEASRLGGDRAGALCQRLPGIGGGRGAFTSRAGGGRDYPVLAFRWAVCAGVLHREECGLDSGIGPSWGGGPAYNSHPLLPDFPLTFFPKSSSPVTLFTVPPLESPLGLLDGESTLLEGDYPANYAVISGLSGPG